MNYLGHLFIVVLLFTASVVCLDNTSNSTEETEPPANATSTTIAPTTTVVGDDNTTATTLAPPTTTVVVGDNTTTTTLAPPTTTESPIGNWTVTNENNTICIMVMMNAEFHIVYNTTNGTQTKILPLDPHAEVSHGKSSCQDGRMVIEFGKNNLTFVFAKNDKTVSLANITLYIYLDNKTFPNVTRQEGVEYSSSNKIFETSTGKSYSCKANTEVSLSSSGDCNMEMKDVRVEAFRTKEDSSFSDAEVCSADEGDVSDIVPIAVGCALAGLVVIVLIAYLVGRRQKRQKGYESV